MWYTYLTFRKAAIAVKQEIATGTYGFTCLAKFGSPRKIITYITYAMTTETLRKMALNACGWTHKSKPDHSVRSATQIKI